METVKRAVAEPSSRELVAVGPDWEPVHYCPFYNIVHEDAEPRPLWVAARSCPVPNPHFGQQRGAVQCPTVVLLHMGSARVAPLRSSGFAPVPLSSACVPGKLRLLSCGPLR